MEQNNSELWILDKAKKNELHKSCTDKRWETMVAVTEDGGEKVL